LARLNPSTCICCGESILRRGGTLSRNPNLCASCSSLADGTQDLARTGRAVPALFQPPVPENKGDKQGFEPLPQTVELAAHLITTGSS
jgi:hypothetical protein